MLGFGCKVVAFDLIANKEMELDGVVYQPLMDVLKADIISLHCPLNEQTKHLINKDTIALMKPGVVLINTSRGGLINTHDTIKALKSGQISALGIDVYEQEEKLFFRNLSEDIIQDDEIQRLMSFPNVLITAHQAFFTQEAMEQIATTTLNNIQLLSENAKLNPQAALLA
jgi:D-lactate dehydrogenase